MQNVVDDVYVVPFFGGFLNIYLIDSPVGLVVVDAGTSSQQIRRLAETLTKAGRSVDQIRHIFITHGHFDHVGGLAALQSLTNATTHAHQRETAIIRGEKSSIWARREDLSGLWRLVYPFIAQDRPVTPARVDVEVKEGDILFGGLQVVETPGHTYGHIALYWPERKVLFGGDAAARLPQGLALPLAPATPDMPEAKRSIQKLAAMDIETLCLGHGRPIRGNAQTALRSLAAKL